MYRACRMDRPSDFRTISGELWLGGSIQSICVVLGQFYEIYTCSSPKFDACQVYIGLALLSKPVATPPYLFLAFSAALTSLSFFDLIYLLSSDQSIEASPIIGHSCLMALHALFIGVAGCLPLKPYLPGPSVAEADAVSPDVVALTPGGLN